jgi:hypothetical protein
VTLPGETVALICALNQDWRIMRIADRPGCGPPFWSVERKVDGDWIGQATFRTPGMILWFLEGRAGTIDPDAAKILEALPARCDQDPAYPKPPRYQTKRPRPPRETAVSKRVALASQFVSWREAHNRPVVRSQPETAPNPPPAENNAPAARAAPAPV